MSARRPLLRPEEPSPLPDDSARGTRFTLPEPALFGGQPTVAIQRWTGQLMAPEYLGAHVSAPVNHQTGRSLPLDFRAAIAFFGDFGIEWDLTTADDAELDRLAAWVSLYRKHRELLHSGDTVRVDSPSDVIWTHGVVAADRSDAVFAYLQLDEQVADPPPFLVPGLDELRHYRADRLLPDDRDWRGDGLVVSGAVLRDVGLPAPARRPITATLVRLSGVRSGRLPPE